MWPHSHGSTWSLHSCEEPTFHSLRMHRWGMQAVCSNQWWAATWITPSTSQRVHSCGFCAVCLRSNLCTRRTLGCIQRYMQVCATRCLHAPAWNSCASRAAEDRLFTWVYRSDTPMWMRTNIECVNWFFFAFFCILIQVYGNAKLLETGNMQAHKAVNCRSKFFNDLGSVSNLTEKYGNQKNKKKIKIILLYRSSGGDRRGRASCRSRILGGSWPYGGDLFKALTDSDLSRQWATGV